MAEQARSHDDAIYMARALALAERGLFTTTPNPRVGCVIVRGDRVVGEGFHLRAGCAHAEIEALRDAASRGEDVRGATLYVTMEPCNHVGRTEPCTNAVLAAGIARVVVAMHDPNPVARGGIERLLAHGVAVESGVGEQEARALNPGFVSRMTRGLPFVRLKIAASLDGRTAMDNGESRWITSEAARADGHAWRARACAVLTGIGTVMEDDPRLTVREVATARQPLRIVVDRRAATSPTAKVLEGGALVVTAGPSNADWPSNVETLALPGAEGRVDLVALMKELARRELNEIHVEAGARLNAALMAAGLVDEILFYLAPSLIGEPARGIADFGDAIRRLSDRIALAYEAVDRVGPDLRIRARVLRAATR